jgi:8-oxo-dGTP pyrophosphatase MutT (NUDIX family)
LQPGGHADGELDLAQVACKELLEETGLDFPKPSLDAIFDIDIHLIPEHKGVPKHAHYDVRYLFISPILQAPILNAESKAIHWVPLAEVSSLVNSEASILRMVHKSVGSG